MREAARDYAIYKLFLRAGRHEEDLAANLWSYWWKNFGKVLDLGLLPEEFDAVVDRLVDRLDWGVTCVR